MRRKFESANLSDNPGRPGKDWARLVGSVPLKRTTKVAIEEAGFTGSSGKVRALLVNAKKGLSDEKRKQRNGFESSQVARGSFGPGRIAVTRGKGCYCGSAQTGGSSPERDFGAGETGNRDSRTKAPKGETKRAIRTGKSTRLGKARGSF